MVTDERCDPPPPPELRHTPPVTTIKAGGPVSPPLQRSRPMSLPKMSDDSTTPINDILLCDTLRGKRRTTAGEVDIAKELIEFFRDTPPPPGNYMSMPDTTEERLEKKHKRTLSSIWPFGKKSKAESNEMSGLMKLPDSAVAGTTLAGHRHIHISIPVEYDHPEHIVDALGVPRAQMQMESIGADYMDTVSFESQEFFLASRDLLSPHRVEGNHGPDQGSAGGAEHGRAETSQSRRPSSSVGAHNMIATPCPELTARSKGFTPCPGAVAHTDVPCEQRSPRHQAVIRPCPADEEDLSSSDLLHRRPSTPESFYTTIRIPSSQPAADWPELPDLMLSDTDSDSYYTPESAPSPRSISSREMRAGDGGNRSHKSSPLLPYPTLYHARISLSHTSSSTYEEFAQVHQHHRPHTLSEIPSLESVPSTHLDIPTTIATKRPPRRVRGIRDMRNATMTTAPLPIIVTRRRRRRYSNDDDEDYPTESDVEPEPNRRHNRSPPREINRDAEMLLLLDRIERLENRLSLDTGVSGLGGGGRDFRSLPRHAGSFVESDGGNGESWLRSDSGGGGSSLWGQGDLDLDGEDWMDTSAGRKTEAFVREQRHWRGGELDGEDGGEEVDGGEEREEGEEVRLGRFGGGGRVWEDEDDPAGWAALESLMRDLVLGTNTSTGADERVESMEGRRVVEDEVIGGVSLYRVAL